MLSPLVRLSLSVMVIYAYSCLAQLEAGDLTSDRIYDKTKLLNVSIELPQEDWKKLCQQSRDPRGVFSGRIEDPFTYFRGDITIENVTIKSVGIRKKGFIGSLDDRFPSLKIKFDEFEDQRPIADLDGLTLNNNKQDSGLVSQTLAYETFSAAGVKAPRCTFAKVTVNGEYLGIYSNVESISKHFLERNFKNSHGNLYEGTLADFYPNAIDRIEVKNNKKKHDRSKLDRLAHLLSEQEKLEIEQVGELVDLDNFLRYWAVESLIGFWDGYTNNQNNYWFYENRNNGKFYFVPWGADAAFAQSGFPGFGGQSALSVYAESLLPNRLIHDEGISQQYRKTMRWVLDEVWKEDALLERVEDIKKLLDGHTHTRQNGYIRSMQAVQQFIKRRRKMIEQELDVWPVQVAPYARKPMYVVPVGTISGSFKTTRSNRQLNDIPSKGSVQIDLTIDQQKVNFTSIGISVHPAPRGGFPGFGPPMPVGPPMLDVVIEGLQSEGGQLARLSLSLPEDELNDVVGKPMPVSGIYVPDARAGGFGMPFGAKNVSGSIHFSAFGQQTDAPIEATLDLKLSEVRGGFMNRSRVEPGK